ncbi:MAG: hypothetical protein QM775_28865 [Pirellulales bacterium]
MYTDMPISIAPTAIFRSESAITTVLFPERHILKPFRLTHGGPYRKVAPSLTKFEPPETAPDIGGLELALLTMSLRLLTYRERAVLTNFSFANASTRESLFRLWRRVATLLVLCAGLEFLTRPASADNTAEEKSRLNVVLIMADDK